MAKSKHATALFEVMARQRASQNKPATAAEVTRNGNVGTPASGGSTPKWWFKSRTGADLKTIAPGEPVAPTYTPVSPADEVATQATAGVTPASPAPVEPPAPSAAPANVLEPIAMTVDREKQLISLRLTYTSALIGGFGVFIALGLAVLIGKGLTRGPAPALASTSTAALKRTAPTPGVMDVQRRTAPPQHEGTNEAEGTAAAAVSRPNPTVSTGTRAAQQSFNEPRPPATFFTDDPHRINGLNYAIIQSYPGQERQMAEQAAAFLTNNGIPCTVEKEVPGWRTPWKDGCLVVGIRGFDKVRNNAALESYKKQIMQVSAKFTNGRSGFKAFDPTMYQWKKSN